MKKIIEIGKIKIGLGEPPLVIPEVGINHNGSIEKAFKLVDSAKKVGSKIIKFQSHITEAEMINTNMRPGNISDTPLWDIIKKAELSAEEEYRLFKYCKKEKIQFLSTPFSREAADRLEKIGVDGYKIGSGECNNLPLLHHIAKFKKPIILSTGMNTISSISKSVETISKYKCPIILLHCTSVYPTPPNKVRLGIITELQQKFKNIPIGFSDHSITNYPAFGAVSLGACIIEKHFTISKNWDGPDNFMSIDPNELKDLIDGVNVIWLSNGGSKTILPEEVPVINFAYASVVLINNVKKGDKVSLENTWVKRPGNGQIKASDYNLILGKKFNKNLTKDYQLSFSDFED